MSTIIRREEKDSASDHLGVIIACGAAAIIASIVAIIIFVRRRKARERERKTENDLETNSGTITTYPFRYVSIID